MRVETIGDCTLYLGDARDILPTLPKADAVVTDPPYGIGEAAGKNASRSKPFRGAELKMPGKTIVARDYGVDTWDDEPVTPELMAMVRAAGRWQIIFGGNYYDCPPTTCWLVWDKLNGNSDFADCELAWTNLPKAVRRLRYLWNGMLRANGEVRGDHPTQKPIGVMAWCLQQLPAEARVILDPFMGSGTTGVACVGAGLPFVGIERNPTFFDAACRRIEEAYRQPRLFAEPAPKSEQIKLFGSDAA
jgi:site-specific DNA-methyltransferase (adenine-specific)/modification methylase